MTSSGNKYYHVNLLILKTEINCEITISLNMNIKLKMLELPYKYISPLASLRIRSPSLKIETGRYEIKTGSRRWVSHMERYCQNCRTQKSGNEFHFIMECPYFSKECVQLLAQVTSYNYNFPNLKELKKYLSLMTYGNNSHIARVASSVMVDDSE